MASNIANKYRPSKFSEVLQPNVVKVLVPQMISGSIPNVYLFVGPAGTGKTTVARVVAMSLLCENKDGTGEPCGECSSCTLIQKDHNRDVVEINCADHNGVDDMRSLIADKMRVSPEGEKRIFILDEAALITSQGQNALLKILEEPPAHVVFALCTTNPEKLLHTIKTRCQIHYFRSVSDNNLKSILTKVCENEGIQFEESGLNLIVSSSNGSARLALQILEHVSLIDATEENVRDILGKAPRQLALDLLEAIGSKKVLSAYQIIDTAKVESRDISDLLEESAKILMDEIITAKLLGTGITDVKLSKIVDLYPKGSVTVDVAKLLMSIIAQIKQNLSPDIIAKIGVIKIIEKIPKITE